MFAAPRDLWYVLVMLRVALVVCLLVGRAAADDGRLALELAVGETVQRDVGFALGLRCDDLAIARAELRASTPESNTFAVTGLKEGTTLCRVGTSLERPTYLFEIRVIAAHPRR